MLIILQLFAKEISVKDQEFLGTILSHVLMDIHDTKLIGENRSKCEITSYNVHLRLTRLFWQYLNTFFHPPDITNVRTWMK